MVDDDNTEPTQFESMPLGARQRVIPSRRFKAVPSKITEIDELLTDCVPALPPVDGEQSIATAQVPIATAQVPVLPPILDFAPPRRPPVVDPPQRAIATAQVPALPPIVDERMLVTERVPKLPPPRSIASRAPLPPHIRRMNVQLTAQVPALPPPAAATPVMPVVHPSRLARVLARFGLPIGGAIVVVLLALYLMLPGHARDLTAQIAPFGGHETPTETFQLTTSVDEPPDEPVDAEEVTPPVAAKPHRTGRPHKIVAVDSSTPLGNLRPGKW